MTEGILGNPLLTLLKYILASWYARRIFWREIPKISVTIGKYVMMHTAQVVGNASAGLVAFALILTGMFLVLHFLNRRSSEQVLNVVKHHQYSLDSIFFIVHPKWTLLKYRDALNEFATSPQLAWVKVKN